MNSVSLCFVPSDIMISVCGK